MGFTHWIAFAVHCKQPQGAILRQVIIVETSTTALKVKAQGSPSSTAPTQNGGTVSLKQVSTIPGGGK